MAGPDPGAPDTIPAVPEQLPGATGGAGGPPGGVAAELVQAFDASALLALRSAVAAHAAALGLTETQVDNMVLVAHELATNAVRHGLGSGELRVWRQGGLVYCEVSDRGPGMNDPDTAGRTLPDPHRPNGRGLWISRRLSDGLRITSGADGTAVTFWIGPRAPEQRAVT